MFCGSKIICSCGGSVLTFSSFQTFSRMHVHFDAEKPCLKERPYLLPFPSLLTLVLPVPYPPLLRWINHLPFLPAMDLASSSRSGLSHSPPPRANLRQLELLGTKRLGSSSCCSGNFSRYLICSYVSIHSSFALSLPILIETLIFLFCHVPSCLAIGLPRVPLFSPFLASLLDC